MLEYLYWALVSLVAYVYVGYPALLLVLSGGARQSPLRDEVEWPHVTLLISAFNEEECIAAKLTNSVQLDYPRNLLSIVVVSDASDDRTDEIVEQVQDDRVRLLRMQERGGKTLGLNRGVAEAAGEIIVFSDANAMYQSDAIKSLVAPMVDPNIGAVIGESTYIEPETDSGRSESLYWRYETAIKRYESALGSVVGGDGAIYAVRRELYVPMSADALSDFVNPLQVVEQGKRCIYESQAVSVEGVAESFDKEFRRKVRIVNRGWRAVMSMKRMLNPLRFGFFSIKLFSHKLLRWLIPIFLMALLIVNLLLLSSGRIYDVLLVAQLVFYALAGLGWVLRGSIDLPVVIYVPYYFCLVNIAALMGIIDAHRGKTYTTWATVRGD